MCNETQADGMEHSGDWGFTSIKSTVARSTKASCLECDGGIKPGSTYERIAGCCDGDFWALALCSRCAKARQWLTSRGHAWAVGIIRSDVRYCVRQELETKTLQEQ